MFVDADLGPAAIERSWHHRRAIGEFRVGAYPFLDWRALFSGAAELWLCRDVFANGRSDDLGRPVVGDTLERLIVLALDHIVVSAADLSDGVAYVEDCLGVRMAAGGVHPQMGTHNQLLSLGEAYLEVIAINPDAPPPGRPRWFDLDNFTGTPRITNWVAQTTDLAAAIDLSPEGSGKPMDLSRGDLTWQIAISDTGQLPFQGAFPGLIAWGATAHPTTRLPDAGCRLEAFDVTHPDGEALKQSLHKLAPDLADTVAVGAFGMRARIETPNGTRILI